MGMRVAATARVAQTRPAASSRVALTQRRAAAVAPGARGLRPPRDSPDLWHGASARGATLVVRAEADAAPKPKGRFVRDANGKLVRTMEPPSEDERGGRGGRGRGANGCAPVLSALGIARAECDDQWRGLGQRLATAPPRLLR